MDSENYLIDEHHKKPYYVVNPSEHSKYSKKAQYDLDITNHSNNFSNKCKKHFGFICTFRKVFTGIIHPQYPYLPEYRFECRIEIHDFKKLFAFRLKHGL